MSTVILLRHARSSANGSGVLAGRTPKVGLDETGAEQAAGLPARLAGIPLLDAVCSPLLRCRQTVAPLLTERGLRTTTDRRLAEVDYGEWTGRAIKDLVREPLWRVVQQHPSAAVFPGGEGLAQVQARAVGAVRQHNTRISQEHGESGVWLLCSHGDVIKAILADALGLHLDAFQRIMVDPCSISVVHYTETRPFVARINDTGGDLSGLIPPKPKRGKRKRKSTAESSDAVIGGSTGRAR
ncbi:putative phosphomutase (TIGR03848 family) [Tamaricihabitans halophyticus]|uniref:Putative phosphomutase (TIGR03848 family) n=1 Tax=Tamaricihabitans halophyticus TaxID=1262583 RepID=A0A4R2QV64_9PSEU|nr:histidine phosphatase family protein [Tamaricihabitans halophyticus]TCP50985.1 putative phosphomutase (TIGR03848 family) [Tamaricihabitans halophyticus]